MPVLAGENIMLEILPTCGTKIKKAYQRDIFASRSSEEPVTDIVCAGCFDQDMVYAGSCQSN
jgi:hypothetical protein